jgi:hypothetical protein
MSKLSSVEQSGMPRAVSSAYETVELWEAHCAALDEIERLRGFEQKYYDLLNESVQRGQTDVGNWLKLLLSDRIQFVEPRS